MFKEIPANKLSLRQRKLTFNIGINDADYIVSPIINGKRFNCKIYLVWKEMLKRCYSKKYKEKHPTYKNCITCKEWLLFSTFKKWVESKDWKNKVLDKDIITPGNKVYSPENCIFISQSLNKLLNNYSFGRGNHPRGVHLRKKSGMFRSQCHVNGKKITLGHFSTSQESSKVYNKFKSDLIIKAAHEQLDSRIKSGLLKHAELILKGEDK